jgi:hypothetical protein
MVTIFLFSSEDEEWMDCYDDLLNSVVRLPL